MFYAGSDTVCTVWPRPNVVKRGKATRLGLKAITTVPGCMWVLCCFAAYSRLWGQSDAHFLASAWQLNSPHIFTGFGAKGIWHGKRQQNLLYV